MRCFSSLLVAAVAGAEESLFEDEAVQLLQLRASMKKEEAELARPFLFGNEAQSMREAECDIWGRTHLYKTFYGYSKAWLPGFLFTKDDTGGEQAIMDIKQVGGVWTMADSADGRFKTQVYTTGKSDATGEIHAVAFEVDGTVIRVLGPEPLAMTDCITPNQGNCEWSPKDPDAIQRTWAVNHKMRIKINDAMYSQFDLPITIPGTNIELTRHSWNMNPSVRLTSGLVIDNKDGFRAQVEQVSSTGNGLWMNVNLKFSPDNIPEKWADTLCGRGPKANPFGEAPYGPDGNGDWDSSLFTSEDYEQICYHAHRYHGTPGGSGSPPFCPDTRDIEWIGGSRTNGAVPGQCTGFDEQWENVKAYAQKLVTDWKYGICSMPPEPEPKPTSEELCAKIDCDHARGEQICLPVKAEGENPGAEYEDCLFEYCDKCEEAAAQELIGELEETFPQEEGDEAGAVGDPHLTTNTDHKFDLKK